MLSKKSRISRSIIEELFKTGRVLNSPSLSFRFIISKESKVSFIAPKSAVKSAVKRNQLRRKGYRILKKHLGLIPMVHGVFIFKKNQTEFTTLETEILEILKKVK